MVVARRRPEAASVTAGAVRCSAWLGVAAFGIGWVSLLSVGGCTAEIVEPLLMPFGMARVPSADLPSLARSTAATSDVEEVCAQIAVVLNPKSFALLPPRFRHAFENE